MIVGRSLGFVRRVSVIDDRGLGFVRRNPFGGRSGGFGDRPDGAGVCPAHLE
jgi:hypothetical protein